MFRRHLLLFMWSSSTRAIASSVVLRRGAGSWVAGNTAAPTRMNNGWKNITKMFTTAADGDLVKIHASFMRDGVVIDNTRDEQG